MQTSEVSALIVDVCERIILPRFQALSEDEVIYKRPGDLVTVADREAEIALSRALHSATPPRSSWERRRCSPGPTRSVGSPPPNTRG